MAKKRRGNGEGSIYQRKDGRWAAVLTVGIDSRGRQLRKTIYGKTRGEVSEKLTRLQGQKLDGVMGDPSRMTLGAWLDIWVADFLTSSLRVSTIRTYNLIIKHYINPHIGGLSLAKLSPIQIQKLYSRLREKGKGSRMIQMTHAVLNRALDRAVKIGKLAVNPCLAVDRPKSPKYEIKPIEVDQILEFLAAAEGDRLEALFVLAISTGMRQGELFGLKWEDIDFEKGVLSVRRTALDLNNQIIIGPPKTASGIRQISLPAIAIEALEVHRKRMMAEGHAAVEWVFCAVEGGMLRRNVVVQRTFRPLIQKAGLPIFRFHDLRHASASLLLSQGVHPKVVQERLGHAAISITLDTYSHVLKGLDGKAAEALDSVLTVPKPFKTA